MMKLLLDRGADIAIQNSNGRTALHARTNSARLTEILLQRSANIEARSSNGQTPLAVAVEHGLAETVDLLLQRGADPYNVNMASLNPANAESRPGFVKAVQMLQSVCYTKAK
jgi:ankyrin repeat protein